MFLAFPAGDRKREGKGKGFPGFGFRSGLISGPALQKSGNGIMVKKIKPDSGSEMRILPIRLFPDPVLKTPAREVTEIDGELQEFIEAMGATMYHAPGLGLAANQVGDLRRIIVFDVAQKEGQRNLEVLINPCIVAREGELLHNEGCLSVPDYTAEVRRSAKVWVTGLDRHGNPVSLEAEGLKAVVLQHEIDHLDGILFIDRLSRLKRALFLKRLRKQAASR